MPVIPTFPLLCALVARYGYMVPYGALLTVLCLRAFFIDTDGIMMPSFYFLP